MTLTFAIPNLSSIVEKFQQAPEIVTPILEAALLDAQTILGTVKDANVPYATGGLSVSFKPTPITNLSFAYGPHKNYALYVEQGTGLYGPRGAKIVPVTAKALAWTSNGQTFIRTSTKGMTPRRYMEKILAAATPQLTTLFEQAENNIVAAMGA